VDEAARLHEALRTAMERLAGVMEESRFERRAAYDLMMFPTVPLPSFNGVLANDDSAARALEGTLKEFDEARISPGVLIREERTPGVEEAARRLGLTAEERLPGMVMTTDELNDAPTPDLEVLQLETADGYAQALAVASAGFDAPGDLLAPLYMLEVATMDGLAVYLGRVDGQDVSTAIRFVIDGDVGIFNVATPPEHRGHGYGASITSHAVREGFAAGADFAWLQSSPLGESVYRRLGFRQVETYLLLTRPS
jgi:ribosomal protein S18 acetylase RimI-like enzyme